MQICQTVKTEMSCLPLLQPRPRRIHEWPEEDEWAHVQVGWAERCPPSCQISDPTDTALISQLSHNKIK